jgi:hypothetical protein
MITQKYLQPSLGDLSGQFAYVVRTVNSFRLVGETLVYADSAREVLQHALTMGFKRIDVAPATPVNGCKPGLSIKVNDTATSHPNN